MGERNIKGITLIALVITIIILLILAGISLATLTGNNGILTKADTSQEETRGATVEEIKNLWKTEQTASKFAGENKVRTLSEVLDSLERDKFITSAEKTMIENDGEITIGSRKIVFEKITASDKVENKVNITKDENGSINYEKLKEDLENIKDIQGVPSDLNEEKLPLVVKVNDEFVQINKDGTVEEAKEVDIFEFASNLGLTDWSSLGIYINFNGCHGTSTTIGNIGGSRWDWTGYFSWEMSIPAKFWIKEDTTATVLALYHMNAPSWAMAGNMPTYNNTRGHIGVEKEDRIDCLDFNAKNWSS